jgi:hypothetical protein
MQATLLQRCRHTSTHLPLQLQLDDPPTEGPSDRPLAQTNTSSKPTNLLSQSHNNKTEQNNAAFSVWLWRLFVGRASATVVLHNSYKQVVEAALGTDAGGIRHVLQLDKLQGQSAIRINYVADQFLPPRTRAASGGLRIHFVRDDAALDLLATHRHLLPPQMLDLPHKFQYIIHMALNYAHTRITVFAEAPK